MADKSRAWIFVREKKNAGQGNSRVKPGLAGGSRRFPKPKKTGQGSATGSTPTESHGQAQA